MSSVRFHFTTKDLNVRFENHLAFYGSCQTFPWDTSCSESGFCPPAFDGYEVGWSVANSGTIIDEFRDYKLNRSDRLSSRIAGFESYWAKARAYILVLQPRLAHVQLAWPGEGFSEMMMGAITGGLTLGVSMLVGFSKSETAPRPIVSAFLDHQEATFSDQSPNIGVARTSRTPSLRLEKAL